MTKQNWIVTEIGSQKNRKPSSYFIYLFIFIHINILWYTKHKPALSPITELTEIPTIPYLQDIENQR